MRLISVYLTFAAFVMAALLGLLTGLDATGVGSPTTVGPQDSHWG